MMELDLCHCQHAWISWPVCRYHLAGYSDRG
jgi:hypothetical protein